MPQEAAAQGHPYTTPGKQTFNGREWNTTCEQYSSTVERCRAEIKATQVRIVDGKYTFVTEFLFNNLTYLPSNRKDWEGNPLAKTDQFIRDGRVWKTSCFDEWTGKNGCRSFIYASVIESTKVGSGWQFEKVDKWLFNNVVQFTPDNTPPPPGPLNPCNVDAPPGWTFTAQGRPHLIKPGYTPTDHYNPISLANFMKLAMRHAAVPEDEAKEGDWTDADKLCFALLGANELMKKAETRVDADGRESVWFPYPFGFSANPAMDDLPTEWNSGLGQAGAMTAMLELSEFTGELDKPAVDRPWEKVAIKVYNSYHVDFDDGGFTNRNNGFLWFEEYPTEPEPTVVNNGHHQNVLALHSYWKRTGDAEALALFDEATASMNTQTSMASVELEGGTMSSYDLLRGYAATPLRTVALNGNPAITETLLNNERLSAYQGNTPRWDKTPTAKALPIGTGVAKKSNFVVNSSFGNLTNRVPAGWQAINTTANLRGPDGAGMIGARPSGSGQGWAGLKQRIPATTWTQEASAGSLLSFTMDSRLQIAAGENGTGGKVAIYSICPAAGGKTVTALIHENPKTRSRIKNTSTSSFTAPAASCDIEIQLMTYSYSYTNTTAWYKNVELRAADALGPNVAPAYDLLTHRSPTSTLTIKGSGRVAVEAYDGGRWLEFARGTLSTAGLDVVVPERYTGRNINYNYHDGHIAELQLISCYSGNQGLDQIAEDWSAMATRPYKSYVGNEACREIPMVLDMAGDPLFVEAEPEPMEEIPEVVPTSMALPDEAVLEGVTDTPAPEEAVTAETATPGTEGPAAVEPQETPGVAEASQTPEPGLPSGTPTAVVEE